MGIKDYFKPTDIYKSQRLVLWLMNVAGYLPLKVVEDRNGKRLRPSAIGLAFAVIFFSFNVVCLLLMASQARLVNLAVLFDRPPLARVSEFVKLCGIYAMIPLFYITSFRKSKVNEMATCLHNIVRIDKRLNIIGIDINYWKGFTFNIFLIVFIVIYFIIILVMSTWQISIMEKKAKIYETDPDRKHRMVDITSSLWLTLVTHHLTLLGMTIVLCYYASVTIELRERFRGMNRVSSLIRNEKEN